MTCLPRTTRLVTLAVVAILSMAPMSQAADSLPIIPGAAGFGMDTPAGSGRHLHDVSLEDNWDASLVAHWDFDDGKPGGTLEGAAALVAHGQGKALKLDGEGHLSLADADGYGKAGDSFTIMAWVYMEEPFGSVAASTVKDGGNWELAHVKHGVGKWMFGAKGTQGRSHAMLVRDFDEPKWRHVAGVYDGETGDLRLYINACKVSDTRGRGVKDLAAARSSDLTLGKRLTGLIDDVMFFDAALTQEEIVALHADRHDAYLGPNKTTVYKVTNLNTEGPGSLRAALEAVGPRVVVFEVSGNIDFTPFGGLNIRHPYVTIAGQTAPSPGITLKGCQVAIGTHDVLIQHIRVRVGDLRDPDQPLRNKAGWTQFSERDCMKVGGERIVIDHCSFSWSTDENVQSNASQHTFRHCIFSEGLNSPKHHKGAHSKGLLFRGEGNDKSQYVGVIGNLFAHNHGRNPRVAGAARAVVINNLIYDVWFGIEVGVHIYAKAEEKNIIHATSVIGNHAIEGEYGRTFVPNYRGETKVVVRKRIPSDFTQIALWLLARENAPPGKVFVDDLRVSYTDKRGEYVQKLIEDVLNSRHANANRTWMGKPLHPEKSLVDEPAVVVPGLNIRPSAKVEEWVLANAGARPADRDAVDARIVKSVRERTGTIPKSQDDVGGWPELAENRRELVIPDNPSGDDDGDGYTNLEKWLHAYAATVEGR